MIDSLHLTESRMKKRKLIIAAVALMLVATACKTTENNYREAYDIAQQKRSAAEADDDFVPQGIKLAREDGATTKVVDGDSVPLRVAVCTIVEGPNNHWALVTSRFKMSTNALASYRTLAEKDATAMLAQDTDEQYLICPYSSNSLNDVAKAYRKFLSAKNPTPTPGLTDGPYILQITRPR